MSIDTTKISTKNAQCQVIWFSWETSDEAASVAFDKVNASTLAKSKAYDISDHLLYCSFSKEMRDPAGTFTLKLDSTRDWKDWIKPGEWILISMTQDGDLLKETSDKEAAKTQKEGNTVVSEFPLASKSDIKKDKIRGICYVDRVAVDVSTGSEGEFIANYEISGRDYGVIYQETEIWYNEYLANTGASLETLRFLINSKPEFGITAPITYLLEVIHTLFLTTDNPKLTELREIVKKFSSELDLVPQWLLPAQMLDFIDQKATKDSYYGNIPDLLIFEKTTLTIPIKDPMLSIRGLAWDRLKEFSIESLHELFTETSDDGKMHLRFRPIPWSQDTAGYPNLTHITKFKALADDATSRVDLDSVDLISLNLGEDNHSRKNHFLVEANNQHSPQNSITLLQTNTPKKRTFPLQNKPSITRHGFRSMHSKIDSLYPGLGFFENGKVDSNALGQINEIMVDYWSNFVFFESGSLTIFGNNKTKVGKVLKLGENFPYNPNSVYYIEGYTDEYVVQANGAGTWQQTLVVTHGVELADLSGPSAGFSRKDRLFSKGSSFIKKGK